MLSTEQIQAILKQEDLKVLKNLGQNFLLDKTVLHNIVETADLSAADTVLEIGPGLGVLTQVLAAKVRKVVAIETDKGMCKFLRKNLEQNSISNVDVLHRDVLQFNLPQYLKQQQCQSYKVVANIPYYITSPILKLFLSSECQPTSMVLLVQKEVAQRICAMPGDHSLLSWSVQLYGRPQVVGLVDATCFFPVPKVDSAILKIDQLQHRFSVMEYKQLFQLLKMGFAAKRKKLSNNLAAGLKLDKDQVAEIFVALQLDINVRAQDLCLAEWRALQQKLFEK